MILLLGFAVALMLAVLISALAERSVLSTAVVFLACGVAIQGGRHVSSALDCTARSLANSVLPGSAMSTRWSDGRASSTGVSPSSTHTSTPVRRRCGCAWPGCACGGRLTPRRGEQPCERQLGVVPAVPQPAEGGEVLGIRERIEPEHQRLLLQ